MRLRHFRHRAVALAMCLGASSPEAFGDATQEHAISIGAICEVDVDLRAGKFELAASRLHRVCWIPRSCGQADQPNLPWSVRLARCLDGKTSRLPGSEAALRIGDGVTLARQ